MNAPIEIKLLDERLRAWGLPQYQSEMAAGIDLYACLAETLVLEPGALAQLIPSGLSLHIADAHVAGLIVPRSGMGHKKGLVLGNSVGVLDADYTGPLMISAWNRNAPGSAPIVIEPGDRIAQLLFVPIVRPAFAVVDEFGATTARGSGGFGSTGHGASALEAVRVMKVYVVGAGAVGRYLGELLRGTGNDVVYAPRDLAAVERVTADLAIVTVKAYDTPGAVATLRAALGDTPTTIVTPQNGVGNEEALAAAFGADNVVACALTVPVEMDRDGRPLAANGGGIAFAPVGTGSSHNWLLAAFGATGLPVIAVTDYRSLKWSKLALNVIANAACAVLNVLPERLVQSGATFDLEIAAIREVRAVMRALKIPTVDLPRYPVRALQAVATLPSPVARAILSKRIAGARGQKPPSLLLDLRAARNRTEIDFLNGAVASAARATGVAAPVNTVLARMVSDISHNPQLWAKYRERPDALAAEVAAEIARTSHGGSYAAPQRP